MTFKQILAVAALCISASLTTSAQQAKAPDNWYNLDPAKNGFNGTGGDEALKRLKEKGKKGQIVIVAVLDSGVEVDHEDLKNVMWVNPGEIAGNGLIEHGAIIRLGRKVLIDGDKFRSWVRVSKGGA